MRVRHPEQLMSSNTPPVNDKSELVALTRRAQLASAAWQRSVTLRERPLQATSGACLTYETADETTHQRKLQTPVFEATQSQNNRSF